MLAVAALVMLERCPDPTSSRYTVGTGTFAFTRRRRAATGARRRLMRYSAGAFSDTIVSVMATSLAFKVT